MAVEWIHDVNAGLEQAKRESKLALLDFSAAPE